jgi:hypothetical protein
VPSFRLTGPYAAIVMCLAFSPSLYASPRAGGQADDKSSPAAAPSSSAAPSATPSSPPSALTSEMKAEEVRLYADAHPYVDEALPKLKKTIRELKALEPASQEQLPDLLSKIGMKADDLLHRLPNLVCDEVVNEAQGTALPNFQGFITNWLVFSSLNQVESRFRYLGRQKTDGHDTFAIGFAQIPGSVESPGQYMTGKGSIPMLLQGIAWFDQSDFRIVRLRTDLLAPQPASQFQQQTSDMLFGPVRIASHDEELWLPQAVEIKMEANGQFLREQHRYSNYRLYQANSKIVLSPE